MTNNGYLILIAVPAGIAILSGIIQNHLRNTKIINEQTGYINFLLKENERLREKLSLKYDPQKYQQEWQEVEEEHPLPTSTHGRFSGGGF